jgi:hypothetical protein
MIWRSRKAESQTWVGVGAVASKANSSHQIISLPQGGGKIRGTGEIFTSATVVLVSLCTCVGATTSCPDDKRGVVIPTYTAPYVIPTYTQPSDDGVALASLLEGAAYAIASNSEWRDIAAGNLCGDSDNELVLLKNAHSFFSVMRGPTPFVVQTSDSVSNPLHPWRAIAIGNLDGDAFDEIVAARKTTVTGAPDLFVIKADSNCVLSIVLAQKAIGTPGNSQWLDVAIGNFGGKEQQIALLKAAHSNFFLVRFSSETLSEVFSSDLDTNVSYPWKAIAAGDLDGDGIDELVAARQVNDGKAATVLAYKWAGTTFELFATSTFGNTGNSNWTGMTIGDFNGDKRGAIVLAKNAHSNFAVLDLPSGASTLRVVATSDLDSVHGQDWRGVTSVDWIRNDDHGAAELIAVRAAQDPYRADLFVYGNPYHRISRDTGLAATKAQWDQGPAETVDLSWLIDTHTNTMNWSFTTPGDYKNFVEFLHATRNTFVDGRQLRVWGTFLPSECSPPEDLPDELTPWHELEDFHEGPNGEPICQDFVGWATTFGRLAQKYPHLVALGIDDYMNHPDNPRGEVLAEMQAQMRSRAPWMNLVVETYSNTLSVPDIGRTVDTLIFYFRNDMDSQCISGTCGENSIRNAPEEIAYVASFLPADRKLQVGTYWTCLRGTEFGTPRYDYDLTRLALGLPSVAGVTAYSLMRPTGFQCPGSTSVPNKYDLLRSAFSPPLPDLLRPRARLVGLPRPDLPSEVTVEAVDATTGVPVDGRVLINGQEAAATNEPFTFTFRTRVVRHIGPEPPRPEQISENVRVWADWVMVVATGYADVAISLPDEVLGL